MAAFLDLEAKSAPESKRPQQATARAWCWTLNIDADPGPVATAFGLLLADRDHRYSVWQLEKAPTTGKLHYQGYTEFAKPKKLGGMKKLMNSAHFEKRLGSREQARDYCMKEDTRVHPAEEHGDWAKGGSGARSDILALYKDIKRGDSAATLVENHTVAFFKYHKGVDKVKSILSLAKPRTLTAPIVKVFWGKSGSGKTRSVYEMESDENLFSLVTNTSQNQIWWDGYEGQEAVLFDDFYGGIKHGEMLKYLDRYKCRLAFKGGMTDMAWKRVYITSNRPPWSWYKDPKGWAALERRLVEFGEIKLFGDPNYKNGYDKRPVTEHYSQEQQDEDYPPQLPLDAWSQVIRSHPDDNMGLFEDPI